MKKIISLPKISIIIPTRDRPTDLTTLLLAVQDQTKLPHEVIVVDDSPVFSATKIVEVFHRRFRPLNLALKYVKGNSKGLTAARNLGVSVSTGEAVLFLDDDTLPDRNTVKTLAIFLQENPFVKGVQPVIKFPRSSGSYMVLQRLENAFNRTFMLSYKKKDVLAVRKSGLSIFPSDVTKTIRTNRMFGCCCYRMDVLKNSRFDQNLIRWSFMEDLDFSHRVFKKNPEALRMIPNAKIIHKPSSQARLPTKLSVSMVTVYWCYVFFKDVFEDSIVNLVAWMWALVGNLISGFTYVIIKKGNRSSVLTLLYTLSSYVIALKHLKKILARDLDFFNKDL